MNVYSVSGTMLGIRDTAVHILTVYRINIVHCLPHLAQNF